MESEEVILTFDTGSLFISVEHAGLEGTLYKGEYIPWESTPDCSTRTFSNPKAKGVRMPGITDIPPVGTMGNLWKGPITENF